MSNLSIYLTAHLIQLVTDRLPPLLAGAAGSRHQRARVRVAAGRAQRPHVEASDLQAAGGASAQLLEPARVTAWERFWNGAVWSICEYL